jgi:methionyl-tRNA formyltransferase
MVSRRVRIGGAWSAFRGRRFKIHSVVVLDIALPQGQVELSENRVVVGCGHGSVQLVDVQPEGKPRVAAADWARGARLQIGDCFDHV